MRMKYLLIFCVTAAAILGVVSVVRSQDQGRYFAETGHTLDAQFVRFFDENGGTEILGYPITDTFQDPVSGDLIQYFQNARVELAPVEESDDWQVRFTHLGEVLGGWQPITKEENKPLSEKPGCRYFPESQHWVCHAFLEYFEKHKGHALFGYPISEITFEDGNLVQYFQRFRLDWDPEASSDKQIQIAPLGQLHFDLMGYDRSLLLSTKSQNLANQQAFYLRLESSVASPVVSLNDTQDIFLRVRDQNLSPISGAVVLLTAHFPAGDRIILMPSTDDDGMSRVTITITDQTPGNTIVLEFQVSYGDFEAATQDSFRVW
jgi:hypothetical protein